jgi:hypothetical protein
LESAPSARDWVGGSGSIGEGPQRGMGLLKTQQSTSRNITSPSSIRGSTRALASPGAVAAAATPSSGRAVGAQGAFGDCALRSPGSFQSCKPQQEALEGTPSSRRTSGEQLPLPQLSYAPGGSGGAARVMSPGAGASMGLWGGNLGADGSSTDRTGTDTSSRRVSGDQSVGGPGPLVGYKGARRAHHEDFAR